MDQSLEPLKQEIAELEYNYQEIVITSPEECAKAVDVAKIVSRKVKAIEEKRLEYTRPLDESKKRIMDDFKKLMEPLSELRKRIDNAVLQWTMAEQRRRDEEQKAIEAQALAELKAKGELEATVPVVNEPQKTMRGDVATASVRDNWKYEVINEDEVHREYMEVSDAKVKQAIKDGARAIKGLRIYNEQSLTVR